MTKHWVRFASVGTLAVVSLLAGCADTTTIVDAKSPAASPAPALSPAPAPASAMSQVVMGPTEGASADPAILAWQNDLLRAVGREGQHELFSLMLIQDGAGQAAYVGIDPARLGMSTEERAAADAVQSQYGSTSIHAGTRASLWVASLVHEGAVASNR